MTLLDDGNVARTASATAAIERQKSLMLRTWILAGLFFMALPGTLLGFSNLVAISEHHGLGFLPSAWMEGHGHAQMFGWIGSFILGIGFYSQPSRKSVLRIPLTCFVLWTTGVSLRWLANIYGWHWRTLFVVSASAELAALLLFLSAARHHKLPEGGEAKTKPRMELWMISVLLGTTGLLAAVVFNFVECLRLAIAGGSESFPHALDQRYLVILGWAFLAPTVWGFSARWLPIFLGIAQPKEKLFRYALIADVIAVVAAVAGFVPTATILLTLASIAMVFALRLTTRPRAKAKVQGIHPSSPFCLCGRIHDQPPFLRAFPHVAGWRQRQSMFRCCRCRQHERHYEHSGRCPHLASPGFSAFFSVSTGVSAAGSGSPQM